MMDVAVKLEAKKPAAKKLAVRKLAVNLEVNKLEL